MSGTSHIHTDDIIIDADVHFTIDTTTRVISNQNADKVNKKLTIMQYDNKSERYSFDIDKVIDGHDLTLCNRVQIHFINIGSNKQKNIGVYTVDDVQISKTDENKITFSWLISNAATEYSGMLRFLITFECIDGDNILYRWSTAAYDLIQITAGMNNNNELLEVYSDDLLNWQSSMETELIPNLVNECYIDREFATSEEVATIFDIPIPDDIITDYLQDASIENDVLKIFKNDGTSFIFDSAASIKSHMSNPNILINGDFRVNQRNFGKNVFEWAGGFTVDRWSIWGADLMQTEKGVTIKTFENWAAFNQLLFEDYPALFSKTVCFSAKVNGEILSVVMNIPDAIIPAEIIDGITYGHSIGAKEFAWGSMYLHDYGDGRLGVTFGINANQTLEIEWAKLELGSIATSFNPRPYAEERLLCLRYYEKVEGEAFVKIARNTYDAYDPYVKFAVHKRVIPTSIGIYSSNSNTINYVYNATQGIDTPSNIYRLSREGMCVNTSGCNVNDEFMGYYIVDAEIY